MNPAAAPPLVAVRLPAGDEWWAAVRGLWEDGAAVLPLDPAAPEPAVTATLDALRPTALLTVEGMQQLVDGVPATPGTAVVITTSGSTGAAKGVELSHHALQASARASLTRLDARPDDRWLCCLPLFHVAGLQVLVRSQLLGVPPLIHSGFDVAAVAAERRVTMVSLVPTMLRRLLDAGADLSHLRCILLGGAAPGPQLLADASHAGLTVVTTYGMTETAGGCVYDGRPLDGVEVAVGQDGRVHLRGPMAFSGYRGRPDLTARVLHDGWVRTADLGRLRDGRLEVLGRLDDVIITGGRNVSATQVAALLEQHPAVVEAAVIGRRDPEWGELVVAYVVVRDGPPALAELRTFVGERAPAYMAPREVVVLAELPRLPNGKVDRIRLAQQQRPAADH